MDESTAVVSQNQIQEGDLVLLWFEEETSYMVEAVKGKRVGIHCGKPLSVDDWLGKEYGTKVVCDHGSGHLLRPTTEDLMMKASRESGIIYPKDAAFLMIRAGIKPGWKVLEVGTGSGSLTLALAQAVGPTGRVYTYDRRTDLPKNAVKNITRAGLQDGVSFEQRNAGEPFPEKGFDAVILDIPTPWEEVAVVKEAMKGGARIVSLNPTFNQIERMAEALRQHGFIRVESVELLERPILAREGKTRPVMRMVSHTEFLVFGVKTLS
jgi:tRNA (adenine57-N1/adenine58-N1)-methyltransferase catalytic subunit